MLVQRSRRHLLAVALLVAGCAGGDGATIDPVALGEAESESSSASTSTTDRATDKTTESTAATTMAGPVVSSASGALTLTAPRSSLPGTSRFDIYFSLPGTGATPPVDPVGDDDLASLIGAATASVDMALFDFDRQNVVDAVLAARARGVSVRMVGDGDNIAEAGYQQMQAAGVPMVLRPPSSNIMHNKFVVVDGRYVWTGSTNVTDNDFVRNNNNALLLESAEMATAYTGEFEEMFVGQRFGGAKTRVATSNTTTINGTNVEYYFGPHDQLMSRVLAKLDTAQRSVRFMIFTFSRDDLKTKLVSLKAGGVPVYGLFDNFQGGNQFSQDEALAAAGIPVWLDGNNNGNNGGILHHKVLIIDGDSDSDPMVITGSFNWTAQADADNDENLIVLHSARAARLFTEEFCSLVSLATPSPAFVGTSDAGCGAKLIVNEVMPNPIGTDLGQEYVELLNVGYRPADLSGWSLLSGGALRHKFPPYFQMPGGAVTTVFDRGAHAGVPGAVVSSSGNLSLANTGGTVELRSAANVLVDSFTFGAAPVEGVSKNRSPDMEPSGAVIEHSAVPTAVGASSPGKRVDQSEFSSVGAPVAPTSPRPLAHELLITQLATRGSLSAADEFIELYNNTDHPLDVAGIRLQYQAASCSGWSDRFVMGAGTLLLPGQFFLVANQTGYVSPASGPLANGTFTTGLADSGSLRLLDGATEVDRLGYGAPGAACTGEGGTAAPNHGTTANGASVGRSPNAYTNARPARDTDTNVVDFVVRSARAPRSSASPAEPSYGVVEPTAGALLVTQFASRGRLAATDEFIELYNATDKVLTLDGTKVQQQTASCGAWSNRYVVPAGTRLWPGEFYLIANAAGYVAPASGPVADGAMTSSLGDSGVLRVQSASAALLDVVAYGTGLACSGEGGTVAPSSGTTANGNSVARKPFDAAVAYSTATPAQDSNNNQADFGVRLRAPRSRASAAQPSR